MIRICNYFLRFVFVFMLYDCYLYLCFKIFICICIYESYFILLFVFCWLMYWICDPMFKNVGKFGPYFSSINVMSLFIRPWIISFSSQIRWTFITQLSQYFWYDTLPRHSSSYFTDCVSVTNSLTQWILTLPSQLVNLYTFSIKKF